MQFLSDTIIFLGESKAFKSHPDDVSSFEHKLLIYSCHLENRNLINKYVSGMKMYANKTAITQSGVVRSTLDEFNGRFLLFNTNLARR